MFVATVHVIFPKQDSRFGVKTHGSKLLKSIFADAHASSSCPNICFAQHVI